MLASDGGGCGEGYSAGVRVCRCVNVSVGTWFECRIATAAAFNTDSSWLDERRNVMKLARRSDPTRVCCDQDVLSKCYQSAGTGMARVASPLGVTAMPECCLKTVLIIRDQLDGLCGLSGPKRPWNTYGLCIPVLAESAITAFRASLMRLLSVLRVGPKSALVLCDPVRRIHAE